MIWQNRQMTVDPDLGARLDAPMGILNYRVDVRDHLDVPDPIADPGGWNSLVKVEGRLDVNGLDLGDIHRELGIEVGPENVDALVRAGLAIRKAVNQQIKVQHPSLPHIASVDLVTIWGPGRAPGARYKNIHVFSDGSFDRSPGGTGTSHMMTILIHRGLMRDDEAIVSEGITGSLFGGRMLSKTKVGSFDAWVPEISGTAYLTGLHQFVIDPDDPQAHGFRI